MSVAPDRFAKFVSARQATLKTAVVQQERVARILGHRAGDAPAIAHDETSAAARLSERLDDRRETVAADRLSRFLNRRPNVPSVRPAGDDTLAAEKRRSIRRPCKSPGLIYPGGIASSIPCTIMDQSISGARLLMQPGWSNPFRSLSSSLRQTFTLVMRMDRMQIECEIVRLDDNEMGVRFVSVARPLQRRI